MKTFHFTKPKTIFIRHFFVDFGFACFRMNVSSKRFVNYSFPSDTMVHKLALKGQLMRYVSLGDFFNQLSNSECEQIISYLQQKDSTFMFGYNPKDLIKVTLIW